MQKNFYLVLVYIVFILQPSLLSAIEHVGYDDTEVYTQTEGIRNVDDLYLGFLQTGNGTYNLSGSASLTANTEIISGYGIGVFNQSGGSNTADYLAVTKCSSNACGSGTYNISDGSLSVNSLDIASTGNSGYQAVAVFNQSGGTVTVSNQLNLADDYSANGTYNLSGGNLNAGELGLWDAHLTAITGVFNQTGGTVETNRVVSTFGDFTYNLDGGSLTTNTIDLQSYSNFNQTGGKNTVSDTLSLENNYDGESNYTLSEGVLNAGNIVVNGGTFTQTGGSNKVDNLYLGYAEAGNGTYNLSGTGSLTAENVIISRLGNGTFNQLGGSNKANYIAVSSCADGKGCSATTGIYNLSGGSLSVNNMDIATYFDRTDDDGAGAYPVGVFNQSGGTVIVDNQLNFADENGAEGTYNLSGGSLQAGELGLLDNEQTGRSGVFNQTGGTVNANRILSTFDTFTYNLSKGSLKAKTIELHNNIGPDGPLGNVVFNFNGGRLIVDKFVGSLVNKGGTLAPGSSAGTTEITGNYTQGSNAALEIEIGGLAQGVQYDWLNVKQTAALAGTLDVSLLGSGSFTLGEGNVFDILSAESITGKFDLLTLADLKDGLKWNVSYLTDVTGTTDVVRLSVEAISNLFPTANAGSDQTVDEGLSVQLNGSLSFDDDGSIDAYSWTQSSGTDVVLDGASTANPSFVAPAVASDTSLDFSLTVTDNKGNTGTATVSIHIRNKITAANGLVVSAGVDQQITEGDIVRLNALNSFGVGEIIESYQWLQIEGEPIVSLDDNASATPSFIAPVVDSTTLLVFKLTVTSNSGKKKSDTVLVNVRDVSLTSLVPPLNVQLINAVAAEKTLYQFDTTLNPFINSTVQWRQVGGPSVSLIDTTTAAPSFITPDVTVDQTLTFEVRSTNVDGIVVRAIVNVNVQDSSSANRAPIANAGIDQVVDEGTTVDLDASASTDDEGNIASYYWRQTSGPMVLLSSIATANPSFVAPAITSDVSLTFEVLVADEAGFVDRQSITITVLDDGVVDFSEDVTTIVSSSGDRIGIKAITGGSLTTLKVSDQNLNVILSEANAPGFLPYGLLDFSLRVEPGSIVQVSIVLPSPAAADMTWWKYSSGVWLDYSDNTTFNAARDVVTITLTDNGIGDDDPTPGVIRDPGGLGQSVKVPAVDPSAGGSGSANPLLLAFLLLLFFARLITIRTQNRVCF